MEPLMPCRASVGVEYAFSWRCGAAPAGEAQRSGAGGWEWTLPETFSWYTPELGGLLLMLTGVRWNDRACIKCSVWSDRVFWRSDHDSGQSDTRGERTKEKPIQL